MKPQLRKQPEVHFLSMPPERWEQGSELASIFHENYESYPERRWCYDWTHDVEGGVYYIHATDGGNITVQWTQG